MRRQRTRIQAVGIYTKTHVKASFGKPFYFYTMKESTIDFTYSARYYRSGDIQASTREVWIVLHGYGQLAQYFIRKFKSLADLGIVVIAPEGLSRFYLEKLEDGNRKNNRVGATWMTRENRLMDIQNYVNYLDSVYAREIGSRKLNVTVVGFSQGSATAVRWLLNNRSPFSRLILWSGLLPPDMDMETGNNVFQGKDLVLVYGSQDPFLEDQRLEEMKKVSAGLNTKINTLTFEGGHDIDADTVAKLAGDYWNKR